MLLFVETRAIDKDRADNNVEQAKRRNEERNGFAEVLRQNEKHFLDMMADQNSKFIAALKASQTILAEERNLSKDTEARITGGNGFIRILPVNIPQEGDGLQLVAVVTGEHVIRGVIFNVTEGRPPYSMPLSLSEFFTRKLPEGSFEGVLGDIPPHRSLAVGGVLHPKVGYFNINIYAFNGNFNEKLEVLLDHGSWRFCVIITRDADKVYQKKRVVNREGCNKDGTIMRSSQ